MHPAETCQSIYMEARLRDMEAARQAAEKLAKKRADAAAAAQAATNSQTAFANTQSKPEGLLMPSPGFFASIFKNSATKSGSSSPSTTPNQTPMPSPCLNKAMDRSFKFFQTGADEGEVCVVPYWS